MSSTQEKTVEQIDWSKAPEGATHWEPETDSICASWMKLDGEQWYYWALSEEWKAHTTAVRQSRVAAMIPRPATWNGGGLPPVGTACECQYAVEDFEGWHAGECIAVGLSPEGEEICVIKSQNTIACYRSGKHIRPIRTPEQIAAEEREKAIAAMQAVCSTVACGESRLAALYDAGYRKTEPK